MVGEKNFSEKIKNPEEQKEKFRREMAEHLQGLKYDTEGIKFIMSSFDNVLDLYEKSEVAWKNVTENFKNLIRHPFGEEDFMRFLKSIDPSYITNRKVNIELGVMELDIKDMNAEEREEFEKEKKEFIEEEFEKRSKNMAFLNNEVLYDVLKAYIKPKESDMGEPRPFKLIYTPLGGQGGYRLKFKRR